MIGVRWENGNEIPFRGCMYFELTDDDGHPFATVSMHADWETKQDIVVIESLRHQTHGTGSLRFAWRYKEE